MRKIFLLAYFYVVPFLIIIYTHKNNINFLIYAAYFVFLAILGFMEIQYNEALISQDLDKAVLNV